MRDRGEAPDLAEQFRRFALYAARDGALRYERICEGVAEDDALLTMVAAAPPDQRRPNILLAAVHYLLLRGTDDPLRAHYPSVAYLEGRDPEPGVPPGDLFDAFRSFCLAHDERILALVGAKATQTNEVGRCAGIYPAVAAVAERVRKPVVVVDLGAAAGLNLLFDRFAYDYGSTVRGTPASPVHLTCELRSGKLPSAEPDVAYRLGLDRRPVDVRDEDSALWLLACQWPDHMDRFTNACNAIRFARSFDDFPDVVGGDMVHDLLGVVARLPEWPHLCLVHSWVAAYLTPSEQHELADTVATIARARPVSWLYAETPYEVPGLPMPPPPGERVKGASAVVLVDAEPGWRGTDVVRLADMHSHGRWLEWYGGER